MRSFRNRTEGARSRIGHGFTLMELMIALSIVILLMTILVPALSRARQQARALVNSTQQRNTSFSVELFSYDNRDRYPPSVATVGMGSNWRWQDPRLIIGFDQRSPQIHRAMSEYIDSYLEGPEVLHCPNTPKRYAYLNDAWEAGDRWDHPFTPLPRDPLVGTYNTLWNYRGYLAEFNRPFSGPRSPADSRGFSKLVSIDCLDFDHWSTPNAFSSCEKIANSMEKSETWVSASCWTTSPQEDVAVISVPDVSLAASFTDGHVQTFGSSELTILQVAITQDGTVPYPAGAGAGNIYIPRSALK